jgi:nucleoside-diphosphate-sugar epimerase
VSDVQVPTHARQGGPRCQTEKLGADLVAADLDDPEGLRAAFTGVDGVIAMTTPGYDQRTDLEVAHGHAIADAAAAASVPHVIYSSVGGAERHTGIPHFDADQRAMFEWFAHPPAFRADFAATRALAPRTKTFEQWLVTRPDLCSPVQVATEGMAAITSDDPHPITPKQREQRA